MKNSKHSSTGNARTTLAKTVGGLALSLLTLSTAQAVVLYDVDFSSPFHTVGAAPTTDNGAPPRQGPSSITNFNPASSSATVVNSFGALGDQPLELLAVNQNGNLGGVTVEFSLDDAGLPPNNALYQADFDVIVQEIGQNQFALLWDAPTVHRVTFAPNGEIRQVGRVGVNNLLGIWVPDDLLHVTTTINMVTGEWTAQLDAGPVFTGFTDNDDLRGLRIGSTTDQRALAYIDNVVIQRFAVAEPPLIAILLLGLGVMTLTRRVRR